MEELEEANMLRGELTASQQLSLLSSYDDLAQALEGAYFVQVLDNPSAGSVHLSHTQKSKLW